MPLLRISKAGPESDLLLRGLFTQYLDAMAEWFEFDAATAYDSSFQWERGCIAYLATLDERPVGFALIGPAAEAAIHDVHEFFVLPESQRAGVGRAMATRVWDERTGEWRVRVLEANSSAASFWKATVSQYSGGSFREEAHEVSGRTWRIFFFASAV